MVLVSGAPAATDNAEGERVLALLLDEGLPVSQAARLAQAITGAGKKTLYQMALRARPVPGDDGESAT